MLAIKDMSGLLKPFAAKKLVKALKDELTIPVHLHTHDTAGNQIAAYLMAAEAGVDIVDCAIGSLSSFTSQPSINSLCYALKGTERDPGFDLDALDKLSSYWADVRPMYAQFEAGLQSPDTEIYKLEIPGGQYSNFKPQVTALGLGHRFEEVKRMYSTVNQMLGDIVKVTPSSKMVGDLAIFMVQNHLTPETIVSEGMHYNFPDSVVSYFLRHDGPTARAASPKICKGLCSRAKRPLPAALASCWRPWILKRCAKACRNRIATMPACCPPACIPRCLKNTWPILKNTAIFPSWGHRSLCVGWTRAICMRWSLKTANGGVTIKLVSMGEMNDDGTRNLIFELNGIQRVVAIKVPNAEVVADHQTIMADPTDERHPASLHPRLGQQGAGTGRRYGRG